MCMNCGCGQPEETHGNPANLTLEDVQRAGDANGQDLRTTAEHILAAVEHIEAGHGRWKGDGDQSGAGGGDDAWGGRARSMSGMPADEDDATRSMSGVGPEGVYDRTGAIDARSRDAGSGPDDPLGRPAGSTGVRDGGRGTAASES